MPSAPSVRDTNGDGSLLVLLGCAYASNVKTATSTYELLRSSSGIAASTAAQHTVGSQTHHCRGFFLSQPPHRAAARTKQDCERLTRSEAGGLAPRGRSRKRCVNAPFVTRCLPDARATPGRSVVLGSFPFHLFWRFSFVPVPAVRRNIFRTRIRLQTPHLSHFFYNYYCCTICAITHAVAVVLYCCVALRRNTRR